MTAKTYAHSSPQGWFTVSPNPHPPHPTWRTVEVKAVPEGQEVPGRVIGRIGTTWYVEAKK